jgi:hypothetical protein
MLTIAQMSRASTIRPKMNSKAASSRLATAGRRGRRCHRLSEQLMIIRGSRKA